jgi:hypothetical protein
MNGLTTHEENIILTNGQKDIDCIKITFGKLERIEKGTDVVYHKVYPDTYLEGFRENNEKHNPDSILASISTG